MAYFGKQRGRIGRRRDAGGVRSQGSQVPGGPPQPAGRRSSRCSSTRSRRGRADEGLLRLARRRRHRQPGPLRRAGLLDSQPEPPRPKVLCSAPRRVGGEQQPPADGGPDPEDGGVGLDSGRDGNQRRSRFRGGLRRRRRRPEMGGLRQLDSVEKTGEGKPALS